MSKTTNKLSPEVRNRAVRMVLDHEREHSSQWAAIVSVSGNIGCTAQTLIEWTKKVEIDAGTRRQDRSNIQTFQALNLFSGGENENIG